MRISKFSTMPRTRLSKRKLYQDAEYIQRKKRLQEYLDQYDIQVENEIKILDSRADSICKEIRTFCAVLKPILPKHLREMSFKDFLEIHPKEASAKSSLKTKFKGSTD